MGKWVNIEDRQPTKSGKYKVISYIHKRETPCVYHWNGAYWVTTRGNPTQSVLRWFDEEADGNE